MGFHPNEQLRLLEQGLDATQILRQAMGTATAPPSRAPGCALT